MTSSMLTGERRWASARRGGMTVLGKVAVAKPINLPSQRLKNHGLDPNVDIVPKGTHSWASRSSPSTTNPWGSSNTPSPNNDGTGLPSYLSGRPSSGGGTSPSTAGSDTAQEPNSNAWGSNCRPLSASGTLTSSQSSLASLRPCSAETRPGSSQLSRFAEPSTDSSVAWGANWTAQKLGWSSLDGIDSEKISGQRGGVSSDAALILEIYRKMKEHTDVLLHSVECLSARLTQVEGRMRQVESVFDDLKNLIEFHHGRSDMKMKEMENSMLEVQDGIKDLKDKQERAETQLQLQLAKLQVSKDGAQSGEKSSTVQTSSMKEAISSVSQQFPQPVTPQVVNPQQPNVPYSTVANVPPQSCHPTMLAAAAPQLPTPATAHLPTFAATSPLPPFQSPQNIIHSVSPQEAYYAPPAETGYQQFNMPSAQQSHSSPPHHQNYGLPSNVPPNCQLPQPPQLQPPLPATNPQFHHQSGPHAENLPFMIQRSSQPEGLSSTQQFNVGFTQLSGDQPLKKYNSEFVSTSLQAQGLTPQGQFRAYDFYRRGVSPARSDSITKTFRPSSFPQAQDGDSTHSQLPTAQVLPYAIPTAFAVDSESNSGVGGNSGQVDDVIDKVVAMGFRRDLVRATVKKLTENGQSIDLNLVLDKLMNNG